MEGTGREARRSRLRALAAVLALLALGIGGCGDGGGDRPAATGTTIATERPLRTFAPLLLLAADETHRPVGARWFIERSRFGFAERAGCDDRLIAVGHTLPELQDPVTDWIFHHGLGRGPAYYRNPYDERCELDFDVRVDADQLTRPFDPGQRAEGLTPRQGYVLDLEDEHRAGPPLAGGTVDAPVYGERTDEGDGGVRLTYWMLFGAQATPGGPEREGDWERVDVLLTDHGGGLWEPHTVEVGPAALDRRVAVPWDALSHLDGSHPVVALARGTHTPLAPRDPDCDRCVRWPAWTVLAAARAQDWYGFGGAWGEVGRSDATTGPLGPHGHFPRLPADERAPAD